MLINLHPDADVTQVAGALTAMGVWPKPMKNADGVVQSIYVGSSSTPVNVAAVHEIPGVTSVLQAESPHPLVDAARHTSVRVGSVDFRSDEPVLIAGPCGWILRMRCSASLPRPLRRAHRCCEGAF